MTIKTKYFTIDIHTHTTFSDGSGSYQQMLTAAKQKNLDGIAITDHNVQGDPQLLDKLAKQIGINAFIGTELYCREGDFLIFGLTGKHDKNSILKSLKLDPNIKNPKAELVIKAAAKQNLAVIAAHPCRSAYLPPDQYLDNTKLPNLTAAEVHNGSSEDTIIEQCRARASADKLKLNRTAGSDAHSPTGVGICLTLFKKPINTTSQLINAINSGQTEGTLINAHNQPAKWAINDQIWSLDLNTNQFTHLNIDPPPIPLGPTSATLDPANNRVLFFDGSDITMTPRSFILALDLTTNQWQTISPTNSPSNSPSNSTPHLFSTLAQHDPASIIRVAGLASHNHPLNDAQLYNLKTQKWTSLQYQNLPPTSDSQLLKINDTYCIVGRYARYDESLNNNMLYILDKLQNRWFPIESPRLLWSANAFAHDNKITISGGFSYWSISKDIYTYNLKTKTWHTQQAHPLLARRNAAQCLLPDSRLFILGGQTDNSYPAPSPTALFLDTNTTADNTISVTELDYPSDMPHLIYAQTIHDPSNHRILIAAGFTTQPF